MTAVATHLQTTSNPIKGRFDFIDGLRGIAILAVLYCHFFWFVNPDFFNYFQKGLAVTLFTAIDLFFVVSGFLIGGLLLDNREASNYYQIFYTRRILRIFPLYYFLLAIYTAIIFFKLKKVLLISWMFQDALPFKPYLFYVQNFWMLWNGTMGSNFLTVTWSLAVEEQFYFIVPFLIRRVRRGLPWLLLALILTAPLTRIFLYLKMTHVYEEHAGIAAGLLFSRWDSLFLGVLAALGIRNEVFWRALKKYSLWFYFLFAALSGGAVYLILIKAVPTSFAMLSWGHTLMAFWYAALIIVILLNRGGFLERFFSQKWMCFIGVRCYFIYLFHFPILGLLNGCLFKVNGMMGVETISGFFSVALALLTVIFLSSLSWKYIEAPLIRFGHLFNYKTFGRSQV